MPNESTANSSSDFTADALANWQWLVNCRHRDVAAVITASRSPELRFLTAGFETVRYLSPAEATLAMKPRASCVAIPDATTTLGSLSNRSARSLLIRIRDNLLEPGGLYVGIESFRTSPSSASSLRRFSGLRSLQTRLLGSAGYSDIRAWYVAPSPTEPSHMIPCFADCVIQWDKIFGEHNRRAIVRRVAMRLGMHSAAFRFRLIIAKA